MRSIIDKNDLCRGQINEAITKNYWSVLSVYKLIGI